MAKNAAAATSKVKQAAPAARLAATAAKAAPGRKPEGTAPAAARSKAPVAAVRERLVPVKSAAAPARLAPAPAKTPQAAAAQAPQAAAPLREKGAGIRAAAARTAQPPLSPFQQQKCLALASAFGGSVQDALSMLVGRSLVCAEPEVLAQHPWPQEPGEDEWLVGRAALADGEAARARDEVLAVLPLREGLVFADLISGGDGTSPPSGMGEAQSETLGEALCQAFLAWAPALGLATSRRPALEWLGLEVLDGAAVARRLEGGWVVAGVPWSLEGGQEGRVYLALQVDALEQARPAQVSEERPAAGAAEREAAAPPLVQPVRFPPLPASGASSVKRQGIDILVDVPLQLTVELGRSTRRIKEILALGPGSVVELDKLAGEAVDVLVNGKLIARGEVVVIDENFGVRVTDIMSPMERLPHLG